jgi:hypothetical protein
VYLVAFVSLHRDSLCFVTSFSLSHIQLMLPVCLFVWGPRCTDIEDMSSELVAGSSKYKKYSKYVNWQYLARYVSILPPLAVCMCAYKYVCVCALVCVFPTFLTDFQPAPLFVFFLLFSHLSTYGPLIAIAVIILIYLYFRFF